MAPKLEILSALAKLDQILTEEEMQFLAAHGDGAARHFAAAKTDTISQTALAKTMNSSSR